MSSRMKALHVGLFAVTVGGPALAAPAGVAFEEIAKTAVPAPDPNALVAPFAEDCARARREIDRARCRGTQSFLRSRLPEKLMHAVVDSTRVVAVSKFDAAIPGYRIRLLGCLTCDDPVVGPEGENYYATFAVPAKKAASLREAVVLTQTQLKVPNPDAGKRFEAEVKPHLRAEVIFRGDGTRWTHGGRRGVAFTPVAMRIFNRCTGEVVHSQPASTAPVEVVAGLPGCPAAEVAAAPNGNSAPAKPSAGDPGRKNKDGTEDAPEKLGAREITDALKHTRSAVAACDAQAAQPGEVQLEFDVEGAGGPPRAVRAKGALGGTPVANCLLDAVRTAKFPSFQRPQQTFSYSVRVGTTKR